jgi:SAM-dependent methyltransferase
MNDGINALKQELQQLIPGTDLSWVKMSYNSAIELRLLSFGSEFPVLDTQQIGQLWQNLPYWAFAWAAGQGLAQYILEHPELVRGKKVLDFGCGSGIVGIAAAKAGAAKVICCDTDPLALLASQLNAEHNQVQISVTTDWTEYKDNLDCLLAADVLYDLTVGGLAQPCQQIPSWLVAETQYQLPPWSKLCEIDRVISTSIPRLDDFDQDIEVSIYQSQ